MELYADGNIRKAVQQGGGGQIAAGSLGLSTRASCWALDLLVNTAGSQDPVRRGFGSTVLAPAAGGSLGAGLVDLRLLFGKSTSRRRMGLRSYASASSVRWQSSDTADPVDVVVGGLGAGAFWAIGGTVPATDVDEASGSTRETRKPITAVLDAGLAWRSIGGDVSRDAAGPARDAFGVDGLQRVGAEVGLLINFGGLKAGVTYYRFGGEMPGFGRGQLVAGFSVQSTLAAGLLNP